MPGISARLRSAEMPLEPAVHKCTPGRAALTYASRHAIEIQEVHGHRDLAGHDRDPGDVGRRELADGPTRGAGAGAGAVVRDPALLERGRQDDVGADQRGT